MCWIKTPKGYHFPWYVRLFFWQQKRRYGQVLEPGRLWARSPKVFCALALLYGSLDRRHSPLKPVLRSLLTVRVSQINDCAFCVDINSATVLQRGVDREKLAVLKDFRDSELFSAQEKAALNYAEAMTFSERQVSDVDKTQLLQVFSDDEIIELTALISFQNMSSKFNAALDVEPQGFCMPIKNQENHKQGEVS